MSQLLNYLTFIHNLNFNTLISSTYFGVCRLSYVGSKHRLFISHQNNTYLANQKLFQMKFHVETQALPYSTIILHCLKYPSKGVFGLLIGNKKGDKVTVTGCVPLCHESTPLAPPLELATALVHGKFGGSLVGVYFSNANPSDTSLNMYATRLADRISAVTSSAAILVQVMNERLVSDCEQDRLVAYEKDGDSWKETKTLFQGSNFLRGLQAVIQKKLYRELADFENHLDNPEFDFYNTNLSNKLVQVAEFRS